MSEPIRSDRGKRRLVTGLLLIALVALFVVPMLVAPRSGEESFTGTDSAATSHIEESHPGYRPWFNPIFEPGSAEVESGLFALQAAIGAGVLGFALGHYRGRHRAQAEARTPRRDSGPPPVTDPGEATS